MVEPVLQFKSHIEGRNADVVVYQDRIEWAKSGGISRGKTAAALVSFGASTKVTGGLKRKHRQGSEVIPMRSVSSVTTEKDGLRFTKVRVITSGNTIDFRVTHAEAETVKDTLVSLMVGSHESQQQPPHAAPRGAPTPPPPAGGGEDRIAKLKELAQLRDDGVLTEEEFAAEKAKILG